jgi:hypothetical protein
LGYISKQAAVFLWLLGLIITGVAVYSVYSAAVREASPFVAELLAVLLFIAGVAILAFWGFVLSLGVRAGTKK